MVLPLNLAVPSLSVVMPGLGPGIHEFLCGGKLVDAKAKPWHDVFL
jgi:hypothetical protein